MYGVWGFEREWGDLNFELIAGTPDHLISAAHAARSCFERAPGGVFERFTRREHGLFSDDAWTFDFFHTLERVADDPMPAEKLDRVLSEIGDADRVFKNPLARPRVFR